MVMEALFTVTIEQILRIATEVATVLSRTSLGDQALTGNDTGGPVAYILGKERQIGRDHIHK
jgi:hypothetical protein